MTTPFEEAGYTKDTKFKVLVDNSDLPCGTIVSLVEDDGSSAPWFKPINIDKGWGDLDCSEYDCYYLPGFEQGAEPEIEVYHQDSVSEEELPSDNGTPSPTITITHNLTIKGYTHVLTTEEMLEVFAGFIDLIGITEEKNND